MMFITIIYLLWVHVEPVVRDEDDYQNYRKAAKQHWDMMKQYYGKVRGVSMMMIYLFFIYFVHIVVVGFSSILKILFWKLQAVDAFREGNKKEAEYLMTEVSVTCLFGQGIIIAELLEGLTKFDESVSSF